MNKFFQSLTELQSRIVSGIIAAIFVLITLFALNSWVVFFVALVLGLQGWKEFARMMNLRGRPAFHVLGYFTLFLLFSSSFFNRPADFSWVWFIWVTSFLMLYFEPWLMKSFNQPEIISDVNEDWMILCRFIIGQLYIYFIFGLIGPIITKASPTGAKSFGEQLLFLGLMVVFLGDTAAFFGGKKWGKNKLWPKLSPNKTVEGALTGFAGSILAATLSCGITLIFFKNPLSLGSCLAVGVIAPVLAQASDFLESLMKRASGTKDSGSLMPGHGGILDRVDGLAFVMPLLYYFF